MPDIILHDIVFQLKNEKALHGDLSRNSPAFLPGQVRKAVIMTRNSQDYVEFIKNQLEAIDGIASGRFFGGTGLTANGIQFAMLMGDVLYFVVNDMTRSKYEAMGSQCFWYKTKKGRVNVRKYYEVPAEILEDQEQLVALAEEAIQIAARAKGPK